MISCSVHVNINRFHFKDLFDKQLQCTETVLVQGFEAVLFALKQFNFILLYLQLKNLPLQCTVLFQHLMPPEAKPVEIH